MCSPPADTSVQARVTAALLEAGWDTLHTQVPNAIATKDKTLSRWGLYRVTASLEVTPLGQVEGVQDLDLQEHEGQRQAGQDHVRVFVHPYRRYITGGRGKIPFLTPSIRSKFLPELNEAFREQGLVLLGTPVERDDEIVQ